MLDKPLDDKLGSKEWRRRGSLVLIWHPDPFGFHYSPSILESLRSSLILTFRGLMLSTIECSLGTHLWACRVPYHLVSRSAEHQPERDCPKSKLVNTHTLSLIKHLRLPRSSILYIWPRIYLDTKQLHTQFYYGTQHS